MEKLNLAKLLKDCPKGMELYCPFSGKVEFDSINMGTIIVRRPNGQTLCFTSSGHYLLPVSADAECMLFPAKNQRDWSNFKRPIVVDRQYPKLVYWFQATGDAKFDNLLMKSLQKITGITDHCGMLTDSIVFSSYDIIDCASKNNNLARAAMMFGVELRIKK